MQLMLVAQPHSLPQASHLDLVEHLAVGGGGHKGDGQALGAEASGAAHAMQVGVGAVAVLVVCGGVQGWVGGWVGGEVGRGVGQGRLGAQAAAAARPDGGRKL